jgi:voltage-gated potassium channel
MEGWISDYPWVMASDGHLLQGWAEQERYEIPQGHVTDRRHRFNAFIARHEVVWELAMAALAIAYVGIGFAGDAATGPLQIYLEAVDVALTIIFVAEFASRFAATYARAAYLRGHWIDLFALIPVARGVRVLRLLRLLRLVRAFAGLYRTLEHFERMARHRGLAWLFVAWLTVMVICSAVLYTAEVGINNAITSPLDALWWGIVTITTVGYGDVAPVTPEGKVAASVLMLLGIGLFSAITATITSFMLTTGDSTPAGDRLRELADLHQAGLLTDEEYAAKRPDAVDRV